MAKVSVKEKASGAVTLKMGEGQPTTPAVHEIDRSVLPSQTGMSLKLTRLFFSSLGALETQPSTMLRWQEQNTSQLLCCKLSCPGADSSPTCCCTSVHPAPLSQGCIMQVEKRRNSSSSSFLKPWDTTIPRSQSSKPKINTASNPSTSHVSGENRDANKPVSLQALLLPKKSHSI